MPDDDATTPPSDAEATSADASGDSGATGRERRRTPLWLETIILLAVALGMALIIKTFLVQAFYIPSASMEPGLVENDRILVQKVSSWFDDTPSRGDVVVFEDPGGWLAGPEPGPQTVLAKAMAKVGLYPTGGHLVKRVVGLPGDTVTCCDDLGQLQVNGVSVDEDAFIRPQADCDGPMPNGCRRDWSVTVPEDRIFVMGDNRAASADSSDRLCGPKNASCDPDRPFVPLELIVGKVFVLVWPFDHAHFIGTPDAFDQVPDPQ